MTSKRTSLTLGGVPLGGRFGPPAPAGPPGSGGGGNYKKSVYEIKKKDLSGIGLG